MKAFKEELMFSEICRKYAREVLAATGIQYDPQFEAAFVDLLSGELCKYTNRKLFNGTALVRQKEGKDG